MDPIITKVEMSSDEIIITSETKYNIDVADLYEAFFKITPDDYPHMIRRDPDVNLQKEETNPEIHHFDSEYYGALGSIGNMLKVIPGLNGNHHMHEMVEKDSLGNFTRTLTNKNMTSIAIANDKINYTRDFADPSKTKVSVKLIIKRKSIVAIPAFKSEIIKNKIKKYMEDSVKEMYEAYLKYV